MVRRGGGWLRGGGWEVGIGEEGRMVGGSGDRDRPVVWVLTRESFHVSGWL